MQGILNLDKPPGLSSARVVTEVKHLLARGLKIGHAGTLDPFATGILLVLVGKATKLCESLMSSPKQYQATVKLGAVTVTDDLDSPELPYAGPDPHPGPISLENIAALLPVFTGVIQQRPPAYSALKISGRRACDLARQGKTIELAPRTVQVYKLEILHYAWPLLRLRIDCGRGTYIRAIARDLGESLGVGGHLTELRRTQVGRFAIADAVTLKTLHRDGVERHLIHP